MSGFLTYALAQRTPVLLALLNHVTWPVTGCAWAGPMLVPFVWLAVPIRRRKRDITQPDISFLAKQAVVSATQSGSQ